MKKALFSFFAIFFSIISYAQQLPFGECGIVCTYDAAGNRLRRVYFCNNGVDPYPVGKQKEQAEEATEKVSEEFLAINALYPNPTTGKFFITFSKELKNARILLTDMNGKIIQQSTGNGYRLSFDLSNVAAGMYMIRVEENGNVITKKVIKQ